MGEVRAEAFRRLSLMAGTARSLTIQEPSPTDIEIWERDFAILADDLSKVVDPQLGDDLRMEKGFYDEALKVAKGSFDAKEFGGLKAATGQFGFRLLAPQDLKQGAGDASTPKYTSWVQSLTTTDAKTYKQYAFGHSTGKVYASSESNKKEVIAFHRMISYKPSPRVIYVEWNINDYPYIPYCVEPYSNISKEHKLFKIIPMPGRVIIHPGGGFYTHLYFDREEQPTLSGEKTIDVMIGLFGLVFGEHDYLDATELT